MNPAALQALDQGACVITATRRLSYELKTAYDQQQLQLKKKVWPTARVFTWDTWMNTLWQEASAYTAQFVLNNAQLQQLLSEIIELDLNSHGAQTEHGLAALWNIPATARTALEAWQLCHQWRISYSALQSGEQADHARFGRWATRLYARLQEQNWISPAQLADRLPELGINARQDIMLFGFDYLNTQQHHFAEFYRQQGAELTQINSENIAANQLYHCSFDSTAAEWQQIGAWARDKLLDDPHTKIGIITPDTNSIRAVAEKSLREQLTPTYFEQPGTDPFHFSMGGSLAEQPLIHSALACLDLLGELEYKHLSAIFLSNFWGSETEQLLRAQIAIDLRRKIAYRFDLYDLTGTLSNLQKHPIDHDEQAHTPLEKLLGKLTTLQSIKSNNRGRQTLSSWRELFKSCLHTLGWPAPKLDSDEFQALQSWEQCLDEWIKLDTVCKPVSLSQAQQSLNSFCRETIFQPRAQTQVPVQIMGVLEAAELDFDSVWLAGFDEQAWPVLASANPFIPINSQIDAGIPEARLSLQSELADIKTGQLCALSTEIIFSHACIQGDVELGVSPVFPEPDPSQPVKLPAVFSLDEALQIATPSLQSRHDDIGAPFRETSTRGGSGLIQKQSVCPFSAYARYRLNADEDNEPEIGMDSLERGSLLHRLLETIWQELRDSNTLREHIQQGTLDELIQRHTQKPLKYYSAHSGLGEGFRQAETLRIHALIAQWLDLEAQRPAFNVIATELAFEHCINGLTLALTLDRIDQLNATGTGANSQLLIDYKSGNCSINDWEGPRPAQPQLPLYFLALEQSAPSTRVDALSFAQVKLGQCQFTGISRLDDMLPEVKSLEMLAGNTSLKKDIGEWPRLKPLWEARIRKLVEDYQQGLAHVDPKSPQSCHFCNFSPLCRIHTKNTWSSEGNDD